MKTPACIHCSSCRFARRDAAASTRSWAAYKCTNAKSECYRALLNVDYSGCKLSCITWNGCPQGEKEEIFP